MADDSQRISLQDAIEMIARAQKDPTLEIKAWQFASPIVRQILDHPEVTGVRAYMAKNSQGKPTLVLVGTDADGNELTQETLAENALPCPPFCDDASPFYAP